ncbi:MAG: c-type cytochrome domain-containing protein [Planctomycetaceae bacterium]
MKRQLLWLVALLVLVTVIQTQAEEAIQPADPALGREVDFYRDVYPILEAKCLACHNAAVKEGDLILESVEALLKGGASGEGAIPGKPDESYVYLVASRRDEPAMPPLPNKVQAKPLTSREVGILKLWIEQGAKAGERPEVAGSLNWQPVPESFKAVYSLALSGDRRFVAAGRGNRIFVYDLAAGSEVGRLTDPALLPIQRDGKPLYGPGVAQRDFVHSLAFSPDGKLLASGGYRTIRLWERQMPQAVIQWKLEGPAKSVAVNKDGTWAGTVLESGKVQLWNLVNGQPGLALEVGEAVIDALAFAPDGETVLTGANDGTIRTWKIADGQAVAILKTPQPVASLAVRPADPPVVIAGHGDNVIRLWAWPTLAAIEAEAEPPKPIREIGGLGKPAISLKVLDAGNEVLSASQDGTVRIWNLDNGSQAFSQNLGAPVTGAAVSSDGQWIAGGAENNLARTWTRNNQQKAQVTGNPELVRNVQFLTDEFAVAQAQFKSSETAVTETEKDITQREESVKKANEQKEAADKALVEAEKKLTEEQAKAKDAETKLAEKPEDAGLKKAKEDADKAVTTASDARDKAKDAVASAERGIRLSEESVTSTKQKLEQQQAAKQAAEVRQKDIEQQLNAAKETSGKSPVPVRAVALTANSQILATAGDDKAIQLWDAETGLALDRFNQEGDVVTRLEFFENGSLFSVAKDGTCAVWDVQPSYQLVATLGPAADNPLDVSASPIVDRVLALAFSPDGAKLVSGGGDPSRSGEVLLWDLASRNVVREFKEAHSDTVFDIEFSRDGKYIVTGAADKFVKVFNVESGEFVRAYEGHTNHVLGVAFQADGSSLASAGADNAIKIWNTETGEQRRTINNYGKQVTSIDFIGVTDKMISSGGDKTVRYHQASNGSNYRNFGGCEDFVYQALSTGDEQIVVAAGEDGVVRVWNGTNAQNIVTFAAPAPPEVAGNP